MFILLSGVIQFLHTVDENGLYTSRSTDDGDGGRCERSLLE
jgi:hypothetical protein